MGTRTGNPTWADGTGGGTLITAARLNSIEGVLDASYPFALPRRTGRYFGPFHGYSSFVDTGALTSGLLYCVPFIATISEAVDRIGIAVGTAGAAGTVVRLGIYNVDASTTLPTTLVVDGGTTLIDTAADKIATISATLAPGAYWLCLVHNDSGGTVRFRISSGTENVTPSMFAWNGAVGLSPSGGGGMLNVGRSFTGYTATSALPSTATTAGEAGLQTGLPLIFVRAA